MRKYLRKLKSVFFFLGNEEKSVGWSQVYKEQTYLSLFEETPKFSLELYVNQFSRFLGHISAAFCLFCHDWIMPMALYTSQ